MVLSNVDRVKKIVLVGAKDTKRTDYFLKAGKELNIPVYFEELTTCIPEQLENAVVKIDPFVYKETKIEQLEPLVGEYKKLLDRFANNQNIQFLNDPIGIQMVLDKVVCKDKLMQHGIATTKMIGSNIKNIDELRESMSSQRAYSVFIKPTLSSGAVGIMAYRFLPKRGKEVLYTSSCFDNGKLVNTKKLYRIEDTKQIQMLLNQILSMQTIVERWYPKDEFQGKSYDLRVVYQFGKVDFIVARQSKGPITNLHLNNQALPIENLSLSEEKKEEIGELCKRAMELFPTLSFAGIDVMLEKNTLKPLIIEINGQGDLLYQDIFHENRIYKNQILYMKELAERKN